MADWEVLVRGYGSLAQRAFEKELDHRKPGVDAEAHRRVREEAGPENVEIWWSRYTRATIGRLKDKAQTWALWAFIGGFMAGIVTKNFFP